MRPLPDLHTHIYGSWNLIVVIATIRLQDLQFGRTPIRQSAQFARLPEVLREATDAPDHAARGIARRTRLDPVDGEALPLVERARPPVADEVLDVQPVGVRRQVPDQGVDQTGTDPAAAEFRMDVKLVDHVVAPTPPTLPHTDHLSTRSEEHTSELQSQSNLV